MSDQPSHEPYIPPLMDIKEFRELGFLQEVNRLVLHPAGLALAIEVMEDGSERLYGIYDHRDDPEGILYGEGQMEWAKVKSVRAEWLNHYFPRCEALGSDPATDLRMCRVQEPDEIPAIEGR